MVELARGAGGRFDLAYGGDTFNTAVYLARAGVATGYATALGDDPHSEAILAVARREAIHTDAVLRVPGKVPGLYMIETDATGERRFLYWRENSPARDLFCLPDTNLVTGLLRQAKLVYFSGITLWLYADRGIEAFMDALDAARTAGAQIVFDGNYRPRLWENDPSRARDIFAKALRRTDLALPTFDDEVQVWGDATPQATLDRLAGQGINEVAVKLGAGGALVMDGDERAMVAAVGQARVVDTTAAGDSFNAGYLAARLSGRRPAAAAEFGNRLAAAVIGHPGGIVPHGATAAILDEL